MRAQFKNINFFILLATDIGIFVLSLFLAYMVRFNFDIPYAIFRAMVRILPWVISIKATTFFFMGVYRGMWRYTSIPDAWRLLKATFLAMAIIMTGLGFAIRFEGYPRSVFLADSIFTMFFCGGLRLGIRLLYSLKPYMADRQNLRARQRTRLVILGAGDAACSLIREIKGKARGPFTVVACLDDDMEKNGRTLLGVPVHGPINLLVDFVKAVEADEILIAMPSVTGSRMREIVALSEKTGLPFKTLPSISALVDGQVTINDLRPVDFEDLLGRPPVKLNTEEIGRYLAGKVVAVTGAGGSIGSELCRQIARFAPASLVLIDSNEFNLYRIEMELCNKLQVNTLFPVLGQVQDRALMNRVLLTHRPQVVFHAAAYKHVPMIEMNPWEGVFNNVLGSQTLMDLAEEAGVERFVQVSTDKAVRPTNVMGACKRMAEILLQARKPSCTRCMAVRFGNVVGSSGSVIPLFQQQIQAGGPVTVTHPEITRYFMTIPEACQLILQAGAMGEGGEIFILEMGTPVKIADMARDLIRLSGKKPGEDIEIVFTGLRPGEKLFEELITKGEGIVPTQHEKIMVLRRDNGVLSPEEWERQALEGLDELNRAAATHDAPLIRKVLKRAIPEYTPSDSASVLSNPRGTA